MNKEQFLQYKEKKICLKLRTGLNFSGYIHEIQEDTLVIVDKFNQLVSIDIQDISVIFEVQK